jgi:hypothetical protein
MLMGAAIVATLILAAPSARSQEGLTAAWTQQSFRFVYLGFQSRYSCYGLRTYIHRLLIDLGARQDDINVHEVACSRGHPASIAASFWVLEPVPGARVNAVPARWESVQVRFEEAGPDLGGCELAHQAVQQLLPYFRVRDERFEPGCTEHRPAGTLYALRAQVLKPDTSADARSQ